VAVKSMIGQLSADAAVQRTGRSVAVRPHLAGNLALLQAMLGQPRVGRLDGAGDVIRCAREIVR